jgi:lipopolysaccharide/colanic/teichoic acid biosynthesis glycosyltransferase
MYRYGAVKADAGTYRGGGAFDDVAQGGASQPGGGRIGKRTRRKHAAASLSATRALDIVIALAVAVFTLPLLVLIAAAIKLHDGGPALFGHVRIGHGGQKFRCLKFRSMVVDAEARLQALLARDPVARLEWEADQKLRCDPRITPLGAFLRKTSLDELPQVFNVLRGEMSIVGPAPSSSPRSAAMAAASATIAACGPASPACGRCPAAMTCPTAAGWPWIASTPDPRACGWIWRSSPRPCRRFSCVLDHTDRLAPIDTNYRGSIAVPARDR